MSNVDIPFLKKCDLSNKELAEYNESDISNLKENLQSLYVTNNNEYVFEEILEEIIDGIKIEELKSQLNNLVGSKNYYVSRETLFKIIFSNKIKDKKEKLSFYSLILDEFKNIETDYTVEDYGKGNESFVGFYYSDGDGLGDYIKKRTEECKTNESYLKYIKTFSILLDYITKISLVEALNKVFEDKMSKKIGAFFIVGGDDVCALFEPKVSVLIAKEYQKIFKEKMDKIDYKKISTSAGLVIVKGKVPIHLMFKKSLELQKSAKAKRHEEKSQKGFIDFQNIASEGNVNIANYRKGLNNEKFVVFERPYEINEFEKTLKFIEKLKKLKFPKSKLRRFYDIKIDEKLELRQKNMIILNYLYKLDSEQYENIINEFLNSKDSRSIIENNKICKNILDIIELYDFVEGDNQDERN